MKKYVFFLLSSILIVASCSNDSSDTDKTDTPEQLDVDKPGNNPEEPGGNPEEPGGNPEEPGSNPEEPGSNPEEPASDGLVTCMTEDVLPKLEDITEKCAEWDVPAHPVIDLPNIPERCKEYTIELDRWKNKNTYDPETAEATTKAINAAIAWAKKEGYERIVLPKGHYAIGYYISDPTPDNFMEGVILPDGIAFIMDKEAILQIVPNRAHEYCILDARGRKDVYIEGGYLKGDRDEHTYQSLPWTDEDCSLICIQQKAERIHVNRTRMSDSTGDGIQYLSSSHFTISNSEIWNNRRQGLSIVGGIGIRISGNEIHHTKGTNPQFGIDLEGAGLKNADIIIDHNNFHDNYGGDIANSDTMDLHVEYNTFSSGDLTWQRDGLYIMDTNTTQILVGNTFEKACNNANGQKLVFVQYGSKKYDMKSPNIFIDNTMKNSRAYLADRNKICVKNNHFIDGMLSAIDVKELRLLNNDANRESGGYAFKNVYGTAEGNTAAGKPYTALDSMRDDEPFNLGANQYF